MKRIVKSSFLVLALLGLMFSSCKKEYDRPPITVLPIGEVLTIDDILNMESGTVFTEDASVYGIITADEKSGNLYKAAFMQDRATGKAIELYLNATSGVRIGDSVRVYLKDVTYALYNGLPQLSNFEADGHIVILANDKPIQPAEATIADVIAGKYLGGLVKLNNVMFTDQGTFADPTGYGNRTLVDPNDLSKSVIVRTSNYANFAKDSIPQGPGNLVAIASVYGQTWQLYIRSAQELEFENYHPSDGGGVQTLPYFQSFASNFGVFTTYDVKGAQSWMIDFSTAKMTGYENSNNYENEDWLISPPVSFVGANGVSLTMSYIARYFSNLDRDVTIQVSKEYQSGNPNDVNWKQVNASWTSGSDWNTFAQTTLDLSEFAGDTVRVAVRYLSDNTKAGTIEVQSIALQEGGGPTPPPPGPNPGGELQEMPYVQSFASEFGSYLTKDVLGAQSWSIKYESAWISGHEGGSSGADYDNEDWLISSPVKIEGVDHAKAVLNYAAKYNAPMSGDVTMLVSTDYEWDAEPSTANWTVIMPDIENNSPGSAWTFTDKEVSLDNWMGQIVTVAVRYLSTTGGARTFEIKSISVMEGEAGGGPTPPPPGPGDAEGSGTADDPYNVAAGISLQGQDVVAWVKGYIVGAVINGTSSVGSNSDVLWSGPFDSATNVVIADDPNCHEVSQCVFVNLPAGKPLRTDVNLKDHPENLGKTLAVYGKLRAYFGQAGLRDSNGQYEDFVLEGSEPPTPTGIVYLNETLLTEGSYASFLTYSAEGDLEWHWDDRYGAVMSGYQDNVSYANLDWLISPEIDLSNSIDPVLVFDHARGPESSMQVGVEEGYYTVWVIGDYGAGNDPIQYPKLEITGVNHPTVKWQYVSSGELSIPLNLRSDKVRIGFKYISADGASATWEIKNVIVKERQ